MSARGKYIVIEGQDGTGKTTQADLLADHLRSQGLVVHHIKEPGGSPVAEAIRGVLLDGTLDRTPMTNILLFTANRHELWSAVIEPALERGEWVISTRNYWSSLAYQGYGEGADMSIVSAITQTFTSLTYMQPDFACMLHFENEEARAQRIAQRGELVKPDTFESKDGGFQSRVTGAYPMIAKEYNVPLIDAGQSIEVVQQEVLKIVSNK